MMEPATSRSAPAPAAARARGSRNTCTVPVSLVVHRMAGGLAASGGPKAIEYVRAA